MRLEIAAVNHIGCRRKNNEDNLYFDGLFLKEIHSGIENYIFNVCDTEEEAHLYAVFDGMGGASRGEYASFLAAKETAMNFGAGRLKINEKNVGESLINLCVQTNEKICEEMQTIKESIGTTASFMYFEKNHFTLCNLGDSPIFRVRDGKLEEIYEEHTERKIREAIYGKNNVSRKLPLTMYLGILPDEEELEPYVYEDEMFNGDIYLACSDGLTDMVSESEILNILSIDKPIYEKILELRDLAMNHGGRDNITIILAEIESNSRCTVRLNYENEKELIFL